MDVKHFFILNPKAGRKNCADLLEPEIRGVCDRQKLDYEIYITESVGDATNFVKKTCEQNPDKTLRFYACGGDGTLNEVINGVVGVENASVGAVACGSGNDFIKSIGDYDFRDVKTTIEGHSKLVDLIYVKELDRYSVNICTIGFDSDVAAAMPSFKKIPLINGKLAYVLAVVKTFFNRMYHDYTVRLDDEEAEKQTLTLTSVANGNVYGGSFHAAPRAEINDGLLDVCAVKKVTKLQFLQFVGPYQKGKHLDDPKISTFITYKRAKKVEISGEGTLNANIDGEIIPVENKITFEVKKGAVNFIIPEYVVNKPETANV